MLILALGIVVVAAAVAAAAASRTSRKIDTSTTRESSTINGHTYIVTNHRVKTNTTTDERTNVHQRPSNRF
ncbi:hypothetical protein V1478_008955 [Vespula squamosa]|uniref:Secreted protein n=1 Tax=Vespula squamosa TaxID=30214 RepID=A0ABD2AUZ1_VESSQ